MLTGGRKITRPTGTQFWVLELVIAGQPYYFGDISADITNRWGTPGVIHVYGSNLSPVVTKGFDVMSDSISDNSLSITGLVLPLDVATLLRYGEPFAGASATLSLLEPGQDYSKREPVIKGTVQNPTVLSPQAPNNSISFGIKQEQKDYYFPTDDYLVGDGFIDPVNLHDVGTELFCISSGSFMSGNIRLSGDFSWSGEMILRMPSVYKDDPDFVPFVFGKPGIRDDNMVYRDLSGDGILNFASDNYFAVKNDERHRYYTTPGLTIATASIIVPNDAAEDPAALTDGDGALSIQTAILKHYNLGGRDDIAGGSQVANANSGNLPSDDGDFDRWVQEIYDAAANQTMAWNPSGLYAHVAINAGRSAQEGSDLMMIDRANLGTPYTRTTTYTPAAGHTAAGKPYTYVNIPADYSNFVGAIDIAASQQINGSGSHVIWREQHQGFTDNCNLTLFNETITLGDTGQAKACYDFFYILMVCAVKSGNNMADVLDIFFANSAVVGYIDSISANDDVDALQYSIFNYCMNPVNRYVIKYAEIEDLTNYACGNWTEGGTTYFSTGAIENPADIMMYMADQTGMPYDRGTFFEAKDALKTWKLGGCFGEEKTVTDWFAGTFQSFVPVSFGQNDQGMTARVWNPYATESDAVFHFIEGLNFEIVGDGYVFEEENMVKSVRLLGQPITTIHQDNLPFATKNPAKVVAESEYAEKELKKLNRKKRRHDRKGFTFQKIFRPHSYPRYKRKLKKQYKQEATYDYNIPSTPNEKFDYWHINNYTGDIDAIAKDRWNENPLLAAISDDIREQTSRRLIHPLLIPGNRFEETDREIIEMNCDFVYDPVTMNKMADAIIASRALPDSRLAGITNKENGWIEAGNVVMITSATLGLTRQVCFITEKRYQPTNVAYTLRKVSLPVRDRR